MSRRKKIRLLREELAVLRDRYERTSEELEKVVTPKVKVKLGISAVVAFGGFASSIVTDGLGLAFGAGSVVLTGWDMWEIPFRLRKLKHELDELEKQMSAKEVELTEIMYSD